MHYSNHYKSDRRIWATPRNLNPIDVENPRRRCPVALVIDTSGSMDGAPLRQLQSGIELLIREIHADATARLSVELTIISFGGTVRVEMPFMSLAKAENLYAPRLQATGATPMGEALMLAIREVQHRKHLLSKTGLGYYQPWIVLLTDGQPTDNWFAARDLIQEQLRHNKLVMMAVGVGDDADPEVLRELCSDDLPPRHLSGLRFNELFRWIGETLRSTTQRGINANLLSDMNDDADIDGFSTSYDND